MLIGSDYNGSMSWGEGSVQTKTQPRPLIWSLLEHLLKAQPQSLGASGKGPEDPYLDSLFQMIFLKR